MVIVRNTRVVAAIFCIAYILIQSFQQYVFSLMPGKTSMTEELLLGSMNIHLWRSFLLLISFFLLVFVFNAVVLYCYNKFKFFSIIALIGFLIFCCLEIGLRSVELFYVQIELPRNYSNAATSTIKLTVIDNYNVFRSVQAALYFPLMLSQAVSSLLVAIIFPVRSKINLMIKVAFILNAVRLAGRLLGMYAGIHWLDNLSGTLYLPFVIIIYGLMAGWFLFAKDPYELAKTV